jgi:hypothetical protein
MHKLMSVYDCACTSRKILIAPDWWTFCRPLEISDEQTVSCASYGVSSSTYEQQRGTGGICDQHLRQY